MKCSGLLQELIRLCTQQNKQNALLKAENTSLKEENTSLNEEIEMLNNENKVVENEIADPFARFGILIFLEWPRGKGYHARFCKIFSG